MNKQKEKQIKMILQEAEELKKDLIYARGLLDGAFGLKIRDTEK